MAKRHKVVKRDRSREGALLSSLVGTAFVVRSVLRRGPVTVAELAAESDLSLRQAYRMLHAFQAAGLPVEEIPGPARPPGGGRAARLYRLRERGVGVAA
jgi:predicted ArsR family transcriptional regulator